MFLRVYPRTKDGKRHIYFALVEPQRTERGPRQRRVAPLGELTADQPRRAEESYDQCTGYRDKGYKACSDGDD